MSKLRVFNSVSLDGYFTDEKDDMSWAHKSDPEWDDFVSGNARPAGATLLFGRVTYEMMVSYWPTEQAKKQMPDVAKGMNEAEKVVFSRTLRDVSWENTKLVKTDLLDAVRALKKGDKELVLLGSGTIVTQLAQAGLVDEYQLVVNPLVLGKGRTMFEGVARHIPLALKKARPFKNGNVVLTYSLA